MPKKKVIAKKIKKKITKKKSVLSNKTKSKIFDDHDHGMCFDDSIEQIENYFLKKTRVSLFH
jgi:hypothetical protein